jgi:cobalamin biosynthesis protein CobT
VGRSITDGRGGGSLITEILTEAIAECVSQVSASSDYRVFTKECDHVSVVPTASESDVRALCERHVDVVRRLRRGLTNALRSAERRWWRDDQINGTLSPRTLHRLCLDRPRLDVFRTRATVQGRSTAVSILLDASGSMTTKKMDVARDALRVLLEALTDLKVATEALTFTTGNEFDLFRAGQLTGEDPAHMRDHYSRFANLEIGVVKQFEEPVKQGLRRLPSIRGTGLTPLGEAMHIAAHRLHPRPEMRKIQLVLTDGRAGCEARDDAAVRHAQHVTQRIENAGIELIGVGIMDESLRAIVEDTIVVHQIEDLPSQLCKLLGRTLKRGLRHVG